MEGNGPHRSQKGPRFVLFLLDTNEERIPFSYLQLKIGYSTLAVREPHSYFRYGRCDVLPVKNDFFLEGRKMIV